MRSLPAKPLLLAACFALTALAGCATKPPASQPEALQEYEQTNDPLQPMNRVFYKINEGFDTVLLRPAAVVYVHVVPAPLRTGIHNMLSNLDTPVQLGNDMLEGKPRRAGDTTMRFVINTTVGLLGFFDPASKWGYPNHDADFGMTLASWGVPEGPFLFLPVLGPSDPRDAFGFGVDMEADPFAWFGQGAGVTAARWSRFGLTAVDQRSRVLGDISSIKKTALDPYATFRSLYRQHRHSQIEAMENDDRHTIPDWWPNRAGQVGNQSPPEGTSFGIK